MGVRADNGRELWRYSRVSNRTANVATPVIHGDRVFVSSDYGTGGGLLALSANGSGVEAEEIYFTREMRNHYSTAVLIDSRLYGYSSRILTCMNFDTGEVVWKDRAVGKAQVISAEGLLYLLSEDGVVGLAEATPEGYRERSRFSIPSGEYPTWTLPVVANGRLYLRDEFLATARLTMDCDDEQELLWSLMGLRKKKAFSAITSDDAGAATAMR